MHVDEIARLPMRIRRGGQAKLRLMGYGFPQCDCGDAGFSDRALLVGDCNSSLNRTGLSGAFTYEAVFYRSTRHIRKASRLEYTFFRQTYIELSALLV